MMRGTDESGFSAVELLITLFIGFLFVMMGYQLYSVSIQAGGEAKEQAKASNLAYERLREIQAQPGITLTCGTNLEVNVDVDNSRGKRTTSVSCPFSSYPTLFLVTVKVKYNTSQKEASHAIYIAR